MNLGSIGSGAMQPAQLETSPALPVFRQVAGAANSEIAVVIKDQGTTLSATLATRSQTGLTANAAVASAARVEATGAIEVTLSSSSDQPVTMAIAVTEEKVLVVRVSRQLAETNNDKSIALLAMAAAKDLLGVKPAQLRGVLIQVN